MSIQQNQSISMQNATKIIRISLHTFLQHYQYFTIIPTFIALPYSISLLISQSLLPHSFTLLPTVSDRLNNVFNAAGFPHYGHFFELVSLKLSQTISTFILTLPFSISFLLISKALILHFFQNKPTKKPSFRSLYQPLLKTYLCNSILVFAVNATCFSLFFLALNFLQDFNLETSKCILFLTVLSAIFYSIILGNTLVVCNISLVSSALETHKNSGYIAILRTFVRIKGKNTTALALAVAMNLGMAAIEALFHYRIVKSHDTKIWLITFEGVFIGYLYSILLVLEVIVSCFFYQSCMNDDFRLENVVDGDYDDNKDMVKLKVFEEFI